MDFPTYGLGLNVPPRQAVILFSMTYRKNSFLVTDLRKLPVASRPYVERLIASGLKKLDIIESGVSQMLVNLYMRQHGDKNNAEQPSMKPEALKPGRADNASLALPAKGRKMGSNSLPSHKLKYEHR